MSLEPNTIPHVPPWSGSEVALWIYIRKEFSKINVSRGIANSRNVGAPLVQNFVKEHGSFVTLGIKCRIIPLLLRIFARHFVAILSHLMTPSRAVNFIDPARFFDCGRGKTTGNANGYFGLFLLSTSFGRRSAALTKAA